MSLSKASITMQAVCAAKAADPDLRSSDPINSMLMDKLPDAEQHRQMMDQFSKGMFTHTVSFRKKYYADYLNTQTNDYAQLIVLCSGLDFSALTNPNWLNKPIYYVDHPMSLDFSLSLLQKSYVGTKHAYFMGIDLSTGNVAHALKDSFVSNVQDFTLPTMVVWEGATYYFPKKQVFSILTAISSLFPSIRIALDYVIDNSPLEQTRSQEELDGLNASLQYVKKHKEPWQSTFATDELFDYLKSLAFTSIVHQTDSQFQREKNIMIPDYKSMFGFISAQRSI